MALDARKTLQDTVYIAIGVGVVGAQNVLHKAQSAKAKVATGACTVKDRIGAATPDTSAFVNQAKDAGAKVAAQAKDAPAKVVAQAKDAPSKVVAQAGTAQATVSTQAKNLYDKAAPYADDVRTRVEPYAAQLQAIPAQVGKAVGDGVERVRAFAPIAS